MTERGVSVDSVTELRGVIRRIEGRRPRRLAPEPVARAVGGEVLETADGPIVRVRQAFPWSHQHGRYPLGRATDLSADLLALLTAREMPLVDGRGLLFLDVETTGLAGGTGTYAFLVGVGSVESDAVVVEQYFMRDFDEEPALLAALAPRLTEAAAVVTFNGAGFDLPLLETRFVLGRRRWPEVAHVDLLAPARRVWSAVLSDCRLSTLERDVLGIVREEDVPGWEIPARFFAYLRDRQPRRLQPVFAHNRDDVLSLVALLGWFTETLVGELPGLGPEELAGVGRLWERVDRGRSAAYYHAALDAGLGGSFAHWVRLRLAWWEKRHARWEVACALWEAATRAEAFDPRPWEELAKFHEHRLRDVAAAHALVRCALDLAQGARASARIVEAFAYRLDRLQRRLARGA
jgi:uncharacterized protein YprB with RNaseH-like and TPR domain